MATNKPLYPIIALPFQRFDIADHALLTKFTKDLTQEVLKDIVAEGVGRVFSGFRITKTANNSVTLGAGEGVAVNASGELMVREASESSIVKNIPAVASKAYPVYACLTEAVASTGTRRVWDGATQAETRPTVTIQKASVVDVEVGTPQDVAATYSMSVFPSSSTGGRTVLPLALVVTGTNTQISTVIDVRRMFAVNSATNTAGAAVTGFSDPAHNFAPADSASLGITGVRTHLAALADRIKTLVGKSNWYDSPSVSLEALYDLYGTPDDEHGIESGARRVRIVGPSFSILTGPVTGVRNLKRYIPKQNGDLVLLLPEPPQGGGLYRYDAASTATASGQSVIVPQTLVGDRFPTWADDATGRWVHVAADLGGVPYGLAALDGNAQFSGSGLVSSSVTPDKIAQQVVAIGSVSSWYDNDAAFGSWVNVCTTSSFTLTGARWVDIHLAGGSSATFGGIKLLGSGRLRVMLTSSGGSTIYTNPENFASGTSSFALFPASSFRALQRPAAGTWTATLQAGRIGDVAVAGSTHMWIDNSLLRVVEL